MNNLLTHPARIVRAIHVERFNPDSDLWRASYAGDEWTNEILFDPPMRLPTLKRALLDRWNLCGLPIVVFGDQLGERAA